MHAQSRASYIKTHKRQPSLRCFNFSMHAYRDHSGPFGQGGLVRVHPTKGMRGKRRVGAMVVVVGGERPVSAAFLPQPGHWAAGVGSTFRSEFDWAAADVMGCQSLDLRWYSSSNLRLMSSMDSWRRSQKPARSWAVGRGLAFVF